MKKIDWIRKLTSRKFWLSVASFVSMLIVALGGAESVATQVTGLIMAARLSSDTSSARAWQTPAARPATALTPSRSKP